MIYGVVAEFNPFHNGHKYLLEKADDAVISVTSSSFVQRGDISLINKYDKTAAALSNGVDLALELPAVYSVANAEIFAKSAVSILNACGIVDRLIFGSECGNTKLLNDAASAAENVDVQKMIRKKMNSGLYYPKAVYEAVCEIYGADTAEIFRGANDILATEYIKALKDTDIKPFAVQRTGSGHDSNIPNGNIAGASYIRANISEIEKYAPTYDICDTARINNIEKLIICKLSEMTSDELRLLPDVAEGLENRIKEAAECCNTFDDICNYIKTKRYTMARIRRILCCAMLGITEELQHKPVPYIRVLGFTRRGKELLSKIGKNSSLPLLTNPGKSFSTLSKTGQTVLNIELFATRLWSLASCNNTILKNELSMPLIYKE